MHFNRTRVFVVVALALGALAAVAGHFAVTSFASQAAARASVALTPVVVAATDITFGTHLDRNMLRVVGYPKESVPSGTYSSVDSVAGQVTKVFLSAREPVTAAKLSTRGGGLSAMIRSNLRAISIEVNRVSGVSGFVLPGDRVDVLMTVGRPGAASDAVARTLLQNVEVLAAGQKTEQHDSKPVTVQSVTVLVDPAGAEAIALAQHQGELHLVLRNPEDTSVIAVDALSMREMLAGGGHRQPPRRTAPVKKVQHAPVPKAPPPVVADPIVRIIRDAKVSEVSAPHDVQQQVLPPGP